MSKNRYTYYLILLYVVVLVGMWPLSWLASVFGFLFDGVNHFESLISPEGVRWALRTAMRSLSSAPWAVSVLCVASLVLLHVSGLAKACYKLFSGGALSPITRRALLMACVTLLLCLTVLFMGVSMPARMLLGVTPELLLSPLARGWLLLLFLVVLTVSVVYGTMCGVFRSSYDVVHGVCNGVVAFVPAFIAFVPASGIVPCVEYCGFSNSRLLLAILEIALYALPFLSVAICNIKNRA
ncbi:MAG: AbgT family transporter [Bacteroidaceae bacterium]|nr:AbgT family transporter [Bacteroidaceae bacterium]MBQ3622512.1 AbgT family transporter [Bacteroidaceae bacterium]